MSRDFKLVEAGVVTVESADVEGASALLGASAPSDQFESASCQARLLTGVGAPVEMDDPVVVGYMRSRSSELEIALGGEL